MKVLFTNIKLYSLGVFMLLGFGTAFGQVPVNDVCSGALSVFNQTLVTGTTVGATPDVAATSGFCGTGVTGPGVWYEYVPTSTGATFSLCGSSYDTKISVFSGACGTLTCVDGNDDDCGLQSEVTINTLTPGLPYYVLVHGFNAAAGNFELLVNPVAPPPVNDDVLAPLPVNCGDVVFGSTDQATPDGAATCGTSNTAPGVWYVFIGTGDQVTITSCAAGTNYDTKISVYDASFFTGAVSSLVCVDGDDDDPGCSFSSSRSTVVFQSQPGVPYWVLIHGFGSSTGDYEVSLSCQQAPPPIPNDDCSGAIPLACGASVSGSTGGANPDVAPFCGTSDGTGGGVWYVTTGTGGPMIASTCNTGSNYDTRLRVYSGSCGALQCVDGNDDDAACGFSGLRSTVGWSSTSGQTYYILVHGFGASEGDFELSLECPSPPSNDDACNATAVTLGNTPFDNRFASSQSGEISPGPGTEASTCNSQDGWCSFEVDVDNSVWFTFTAPASGCVSIVADGFDSQVALYSVVDCNDFNTYTEIAANDDSGDDVIPGANIFSGGILEAACLMPGASYYIQVDGFDGAESANGILTITDCNNGPLVANAGDCQSLFAGYPPVHGDTAYLVASGSGGFPPYTCSWSGNDILYINDCGAAVQPSVTTTYTVTITDAKGCTASSTVDVIVEDVVGCYLQPQSGDFRTQTQGGWGSNPNGNNPGAYLQSNFGTAFPNGLVVGCNNTITLTSAQAVARCLPEGGPPRALTQNFIDPTNTGSVLSGQVIALGVSLGLDDAIPSYSSSVIALRDLQVASGPFAGFTVGDLYDLANEVLGGCNTTVSASQLNNAISSINQNFVDGNSAGSFLLAPGINVCDGQNTNCVRADDVAGLLAQGQLLGSCTNTCRASNPYVSPPPVCVDVVVDLTTDSFGGETSWQLVDVTDNVVIDERINGDLGNNETTSSTYCVDDEHCYEFRLADSFGDGFCCNFGSGAYTISFDGAVVASSGPGNNVFTSGSRIEAFGSCGSNKASEAASIAEVSGLSISAYPNPSNGLARIKFSVPQEAHVSLEVFGMNGQKVASLFEGTARAGYINVVEFNGSGLGNGVYIYRMTTSAGDTEAGKLFINR